MLYTTKQVAEYVKTTRSSINYHIRKGNLKAIKTEDEYFRIEYKEMLRFADWFLYDKGKNVGVAYKKIPDIDDFEDNPDLYNSYQALQVQKHKEILYNIIIYRKKRKEIIKIFGYSNIRSIEQILSKNKYSRYKLELENKANKYHNSDIKIGKKTAKDLFFERNGFVKR